MIRSSGIQGKFTAKTTGQRKNSFENHGIPLFANVVHSSWLLFFPAREKPLINCVPVVDFFRCFYRDNRDTL
jgi:hypothetical protein